MKLVTLSLSRQICNPLCTFVAVILVFHQQTALHSAVQCTSTTHYLLSTTHYPLQASLFTKSKTQRTFLSSRQSYWADQACGVSIYPFTFEIVIATMVNLFIFQVKPFQVMQNTTKGCVLGFYNEKRAVKTNSNPVT